MSEANDIWSALKQFGRQITLRRQTLIPGSAQVPLDVAVYAVTRNYTAKELIGSIIQGDTEVTFTNSEIATAQWPGPPKNGDKVVIDGKMRNIESVEPKYLGTVILVYICQVRG